MTSRAGHFDRAFNDVDGRGGGHPELGSPDLHDRFAGADLKSFARRNDLGEDLAGFQDHASRVFKSEGGVLVQFEGADVGDQKGGESLGGISVAPGIQGLAGFDHHGQGPGSRRVHHDAKRDHGDQDRGRAAVSPPQ